MRRYTSQFDSPSPPAPTLLAPMGGAGGASGGSACLGMPPQGLSAVFAGVPRGGATIPCPTGAALAAPLTGFSQNALHALVTTGNKWCELHARIARSSIDSAGSIAARVARHVSRASQRVRCSKPLGVRWEVLRLSAGSRCCNSCDCYVKSINNDKD